MSDAFDWLRTRPPVVQALMLRLPLVCRVRAVAGKVLVYPAPGRIGRVVSYMEDGMVTVMDEAEWLAEKPGAIRGTCDPDWLEVVQYDGNKTPDWVRRVLAGENVPPENPGLEGRIEGEFPVVAN